MSSDFHQMEPFVRASLKRMTHTTMSSAELEAFQNLKSAMNAFDSRATGVLKAVNQLLDDEELLRLLHLSKLYETPSIVNDLNQMVIDVPEVMLEVYVQDINTTRSKMLLMKQRMQDTESLVMLKLDAIRNYLISADVVFNLVAMAMTFGMFVTGTFGMNLASGVEVSEGWFWGIVALISTMAVVVSVGGILFFRYRGVL
jgi:magnesium transporter